MSLFLSHSATFQEQFALIVREVLRAETKPRHKYGVTMDEWVAKRVYLINKKRKKKGQASCGEDLLELGRREYRRKRRRGTGSDSASGWDSNLHIAHLAGTVPSIFLMQVSGRAEAFPTAVLPSCVFPQNSSEGFGQEPCIKLIYISG
jgi:hypothetical protein